MTELEHTTTVQKTLQAKTDIRVGRPMVCWSLTKTTSSKHEQNM